MYSAGGLPFWGNDPAIGYPTGAPVMAPLLPGGVGSNDLTLLLDTGFAYATTAYAALPVSAAAVT